MGQVAPTPGGRASVGAMSDVTLHRTEVDLGGLLEVLGKHFYSTPAVVVRHGTTRDQRVLTRSLDALAEAATTSGIKPPALLIVGEVVGLQQNLCWFASSD